MNWEDRCTIPDKYVFHLYYQIGFFSPASFPQVMGLALPVPENEEQRWPVLKLEDPFTGALLRAQSATNWSRTSTAGFLAKCLSGERWCPSGARRSSSHVAGLQEQRWLVRRLEGPYSGGETLSSIGNELVETPHRGIFSGDSVGRAVAPIGGAAKQRPRGRAKRYDGSNGSQRTRTRGRNSQLDR